MRSIRIAARFVALASSVLLPWVALSSSACGSDPKPAAKTASPTTAQLAPTDPKAQALAPPNSPTASSINIDESILKACGIEKPKAHFAFDSANLEGQDTSTLEAVAKCFSSGALKERSLKLIGHADPRGETEYNFVLGNSRADAVGGFLRSKGMEKAKLAATSRGELDATGTDEPGWARDRRVDLMLAQ